jgi:hypothetical protein
VICSVDWLSTTIPSAAERFTPNVGPALQEARAQTHKGVPAREIRGTLNLIDAQQRLASGEDMSAGLLDLIFDCPLSDRIGALLRARGRRADIEALASKLGHHESGVRWRAGNLLIQIGPPVRPVIEEFLARAEDETARDNARRVLDETERRSHPEPQDGEDDG